MINKKAQMNFEVIFAIIVGGMILFLAIYGAMRFSDSSRKQTDTEVAKKLSVLTNPMQAGFAESQSSKIIFNQETKLYNYCFAERFGKNDIAIATKSSVGEEWNVPGNKIAIYNKYLFSEDIQQGKELWIFSKGFEFPYKVADLIFLSMNRYCFVTDRSSKKIAEEVTSLKIENIKITESIENCSEEEIKVCFGTKSGCEIEVFGSGEGDAYSEGYVQKDGKRMYYYGSLMYGAIFTNKEIYDCEVQRLLYRDARLAEIYLGKADLMNARGCNTNIVEDLKILSINLGNASADDFLKLKESVKALDKKAKTELCRTW
jgi:hypothetical protein